MNINDINTYLASGLSVSDVALLMAAEKAMTPAPVIQQPLVQQTPAPVIQQTPAPVIQQTPAPVQPPTVQQTPAPIQQPIVQQTPAPVQQVLQQPAAQQPNDFSATLAAIGAAMQQPANNQAPVTNNQPAITPANAGITPEAATQLFQAWSRGAATQNVELPPNADDVLAARFKSLYGVDTTNQNTNK